MSFSIDRLSSQQYQAYLIVSHKKKSNSWTTRFHDMFISHLSIGINRMAYLFRHGFATYPHNAYLFQKFKAYDFNKIESPEQLKEAKEIYMLFKKCQGLHTKELTKLEENLNFLEDQLTQDSPFFSSSDLINADVLIDDQTKKLNVYQNQLEAEFSEKHIVYCDQTQRADLIDAKTYQEAVKQLPIVCVDIFLYHPRLDTYLLVFRKNAPAKEMWWMPGGRMYKGESFFEAAKRKCWDEVKVKIHPIAQLGTYSTVFPDSEWGCQTHTINTVVFAIFSSEKQPEVNLDHADYQWRSLKIPPNSHDPYLNQAYQEALVICKNLKEGFLKPTSEN